MSTITWTIEQLDRQLSDGLVTTAYWRCTAVDGDYSTTAYGSVGLERGDTFVEYNNLTQEQVIDWVKDKLGNPSEIESNLQSQIDALKIPVKATGLPW